MDRPLLSEALRDEAAVLGAFVAPGRFPARIPTKLRKRIVVLNHVAQRFEVGRTWSETEVNAVLRPLHPDVAALRRYLVDEGFLDRKDGVYWRSGGTVDDL